MANDEALEALYEGLECGMCGNPISPGVLCGDAGEEDDCPLANDGPGGGDDE